jgi:hypothetical protein
MSVSGASAKAAHVVLRPVLHFDEEDSQVRFDECARRLILIKHRQFAAFSTVPTLPPIVVDSNGKVENVRFSLNHRFAALQRSDTVIDFVDLQTNASFTHAVKGGGSRGRWRILSYHWTGTPVADFFVVTTAGVEFYLVLPEKGCLKLVKALALAVAWAVYSHATRLLLLATGAQDNVLHGVQIQPSALVRLPKFEVQLAPPAELPSSAQSLGQPKLRRSLLPNDIFVARLYESIYCIQVEAERQQLLLYQLFRDFVVRKFALAIYSSRAVMSVSDNLLVVHALDSKVSAARERETASLSVGPYRYALSPLAPLALNPPRPSHRLAIRPPPIAPVHARRRYASSSTCGSTSSTRSRRRCRSARWLLISSRPSTHPIGLSWLRTWWSTLRRGASASCASTCTPSYARRSTRHACSSSCSRARTAPT